VEEATDLPRLQLRNGERRAGRIQVVHGHREPALCLVAAPRLRDCIELLAQGGIDVVGVDDPEAISGLRQSRHRLPDFSDRTAFERELARNEDRLVPDCNRAHAEPLVAHEVLAERADHRKPPAASVREALEVDEETVELALVADRVAADQRGAGDDAIGEERFPAR
jgi:hypothetical protein